MSGMSSGYDHSVQTFSPDGRVFQVEYAQKAVDASGTLVGIKCKDGVVLLEMPCKIEECNKCKYAVCGMLPDGRQISNQSREQAEQHRKLYGELIPAKVLMNDIQFHVHVYTLYGSYRPYGASCLFACHDQTGYSLYLLEPTGVAHSYKGIAIGKGRQAARTEIEKLDFANLTVEQAVFDVARILHMAHDSEKAFELEISVISDATKHRHVHIPKDLLQQADEAGLKSLEDDMDED